MTAQSGVPRTGARFRGGPLAMLVLLVIGWTSARAMWWENPFLPLADALQLPLVAASAQDGPALLQTTSPVARPLEGAGTGALPLTFAALGWGAGGRRLPVRDAQLVAAHHLLWFAALRDPAAGESGIAAADSGLFSGDAEWSAPAAFLPVRASRASGRWSADAWAFWRQGSDAAPISQGRVPIYGASQVGGVLQYRLAPDSVRDPRVYARAYRALVRRGESELALGGSVRPVGRLPLRVAGEVRYTDGAFRDSFRPAAYVVSELAPVALPYGVQLEAYGQAGWVGGPDATGFADGQASVTRELREVAGLTDNALRLSLGAAAWGGAQKDAQRIDVGPTLRLDVTLGEVPARLSVDWRERVGGDAGPDSGLAATLSTSF